MTSMSLLAGRTVVLSTDNFCKQFGPNKISDLNLIQAVWHSDGIPERIFKKIDFENNQQMIKKNEKLPSRQKKSDI